MFYGFFYLLPFLMLHLLTSALAFGSSTKPPPPGPAPAKGDITRVCDCKFADQYQQWNITTLPNKLVHISTVDNRCLAIGPGPGPYIYSGAALVDCGASYPPSQFFEWKIDVNNGTHQPQIQFGVDTTLCLASFSMDKMELGLVECAPSKPDKRFNSYLKTDPNGQDQGIYRIVADNRETSCATVTAFPNCTEPVI